MPNGVIDRALAMTFLKVGIASGAMALAILVKNVGFDAVLAVIAAALSYGALVLITGAATMRDLGFVRALVVRKLRPVRPSIVG